MSKPTVQVIFPIMGTRFRPMSARNLLELANETSRVELEAEPENKFDPNAIKVLLCNHSKLESDNETTAWEHIGYVPKFRCGAILGALELHELTEVEILPQAQLKLTFTCESDSRAAILDAELNEEHQFSHENLVTRNIKEVPEALKEEMEDAGVELED